MDSLTVIDAHHCIDEILHGSRCNSSSDYLHNQNLWLQRVHTATEWKAVTEFLSRDPERDESSQPEEELSALIPFFFAIGLYQSSTGTSEPPCGVVTMYSAYSTWDGRCLFIDRFDIPNADDVEMEKSILRVLAKIAVKLGCARLNWRRINIPTWYIDTSMPPEILYGWLTLRMERLAMLNYVDMTQDDLPTESSNNGLLSTPLVKSSFERCLAYANESLQRTSFRLRLSTSEDVDTIVRLVHGLAVYEKEPDAVHVTSENYRCDGHCSEPLFYCLLLDDVKTSESAGMAFIYFGYELGRGRFLYLEDLYLEEAYRKRGAGSLVMKFLARMALDLCCQNFYWMALDWNTPALNLYEKIGAKVQKGVLTVRYTQDKLKDFANASG